MRFLLFFFVLCNVLFYTSKDYAKEIIIYADSISYDSKSNLIAKGNAKIISKDEVITSDLIIINEKNKKITLPIEFQFKDTENNFYYGSSGEFSSSLEDAKIENIKILLNDGSRIHSQVRLLIFLDT